MLRALELNGFKSFADQTRFDFPEGITVVVGPNGSGKSNIVDAIKWVLGSQSAKSLRGGEMSDVIFKGSAASGRKPANSAEATLVLDNANRVLGVDSDEVTVSRRVYRSGESEYLINRQPCRLKDVRDLFRGTGVGVDAYSLIEQGKVDRMLQASPKDRRAIFEEAAGISRFKAKKVEAERRLQRVNQNLLRLSDIVDEVHGRLNLIKNQASKAQRYREITDRMQHLRLMLGHLEFAELNEHEKALIQQADEIGKRIAEKSDALEQSKRELASHQSKVHAFQTEVEALQAEIRKLETREVTLESQQSSLQERTIELEAESQVVSQQSEQLRKKADTSAEQIAEREATLQSLQTRRLQLEDAISVAQNNASAIEAECELILEQVEQDRAELDKLKSDLSAKNVEASSLTQRIAETDSEIAHRTTELQDHYARKETITAALVAANQELESRQSRVAEKIAQLAAKRAKVQEQRDALRTAQEQCIVLQGKQESMRDRFGLLERLDLEHAGLGDGARQLIELSKSKPHAPYNSIAGLVADIIEVEVHLAPLIDVALSHLSEAVVLNDGQIVDLLQQKKLKINGRATLLRLDRLPSRRAGDRIQLDGLRGVIGRADRLIHSNDQYQTLVQFLLGTTWLVDSLQTAIDLSHYRGSGLRFVTADCERIDTDGTIQIGSLQTLSGIVTRRSEMQAVRDEAALIAQSIQESSREVAALEQSLNKAIEANEAADEDLRESQLSIEQFKFEMQNLSQQFNAVETAIEQCTTDLQRRSEALESSKTHLQKIRNESESNTAIVESTEKRIADKREVWKKLQESKHAAMQALTHERLEAAKFDHKLSSERELLQALVLDCDERLQLADQASKRFSDTIAKLQQTRTAIESSIQELASIKTILGEHREKLSALQIEFAAIKEQYSQCQVSVHEISAACEKLLNQQEESRRSIAQLQQRRDALLQTYRDEHQINLHEAMPDALAEQAIEKDKAAKEIAELRAEIVAVGSVNMEALAELDALQTRYDSLHAHFIDLESARDSLLKIIDRIENKSKEMFLTTLEAIRSNFQTLYRRSFGGGSADIILEDPNDVLNCGVEVIATPPGKIALSNSLLSGGEKALTAVALIMAIFQFRPSPFCILDEVDAPFDEANIGRFVNVLKDFLHMTKFIVVSHSKKTMTVANTIYGVTMQESGVSRQVAVRFEEVGDDGEILDRRSNKAA